MLIMRRCLELLEVHPGPLIVPTLVITEVAYPIASRLGWQAETRCLGDLAAGEMSLEPVDPRDILRIAELVARYHTPPIWYHSGTKSRADAGSRTPDPRTKKPAPAGHRSSRASTTHAARST